MRRKIKSCLKSAVAMIALILLLVQNNGSVQSFCAPAVRPVFHRIGRKTSPSQPHPRTRRFDPLWSFEIPDADNTATSQSPELMEPDFLLESDPNDHRYSASDWLHNMKSLPRSTILRETRGPVLAVVIWSTVVSLLYKGLFALGGAEAAARMCIDSKPHSFLVSALGLLLVFRTNSAYQRFAEGRIIWERILSISRNTSRMVILYEKEFGAARCRRFFRLLAAFPYLLHHHIQPINDPSLAKEEHGIALTRSEPVARRRGAQEVLVRALGGTTNSNIHNSVLLQESTVKRPDVCWVDRRKLPWNLLPLGPLKLCARASNRPLWACDRLSQEVNEIEYTPNYTSRERLTLLSQIGKLSKCIGECERIHQTAVPLNYARHSLRSLTLWLFTLPFALVRDFGILTGPVMGMAAWLFYGIYQIGYTIEDPFQGSLRLSALCDAIFRDVMMGTDVMKRRMTAFRASELERDEWARLDSNSLSSDTSQPRP